MANTIESPCVSVCQSFPKAYARVEGGLRCCR